MITIGAIYWDQGGKISGGAGTVEIRDDQGNRFDFDDLTWKSTVPTSPTTALAEDAVNDAGFYSLEVDESTWGTRRWDATIRLIKEGWADDILHQFGTVIAGQVASPIFVPTPGAGVPVVLRCLTPDGSPRASAPQAFLCLDAPASDMAAIARTGAWEGVEGTLTWIVPTDCVVLISCQEYGICGGYTVEDEEVILNTASPIY